MKTNILNQLMEVQFCPSIASTEFYELMIQLGLNLVVLLVIARAMYFRWNRNPEYMFAMLIIGLIVFIICALLRWVKLELGLVLGLFAIFAIIRFRTINVPVKEMAYIFMVVGVSAVNALLPISDCFQWLLLSNLLLIMMTFILETTFFSKKLACRTIMFYNTELLKPSKRNKLLQELKELTELDIVRFEIGKVDYIKKHAQIWIYYKGEGDECYDDNRLVNDDD